MMLSTLMKSLMASVLVAGGVALAAAPSPALAAKKKPNVLLLLTDDVGIDQVRLFGYESLPPAPPTPNLSTLQSAGLTFRNAWSMPACSTARGVLYTGRYPFRTELEAALGPSDLANSMISPYARTIPKLMSKAGYATALFGKFHIGLQGNNPYGLSMVNAVGWDYFNGWLDETGDPSSIDTSAGLGEDYEGLYPNGYVPGSANGGTDTGACYTSAGTCTPLTTAAGAKNPAGRMCRDDGGIFVPDGACTTPMPSNLDFQTLSAHYVSPVVISQGGRAYSVPPTDKRARTFRNVQQTDAAIDWIKKQQQRGKPWFATISTATVHTPLQVPPVSTLPPDAPDANGADLSTTEGKILIANQMIQALDTEFGRLLTSTGLAKKQGDQLVLTAAAKNTMVIYVNDNGSLGSQVRLPFDPYRAKGTSYQTGVWTPMVIAGARVNQANLGENVEALVNIADLYELIGTVGGVNVRKNNPYIIDSKPMIQYLADNEAPSARIYDFNLVGPNLQADGGINGPCQFPGSNPPSCSQIPVTKGVCEDNGGTWFGTGATGSYPTGNTSTPIPSEGFQYCCQVQQWIAQNGGTPGTVIPTTSMAVRDRLGYKLVRNQWNNYDANSSTGCQQTSVDELYIIGQSNPPSGNPRLDIDSSAEPYPPEANTLIATPYQGVDLEKYNELNSELESLLASEPDCLSKGDGNDDGVVDYKDLRNYRQMALKTSGSSWYDVNLDGQTNSEDQQIISANLGTSGAACSD